MPKTGMLYKFDRIIFLSKIASPNQVLTGVKKCLLEVMGRSDDTKSQNQLLKLCV